MEKDRGFKIIAIAALLFSVVGLSIAYAGFTSTLTVEGTATAASAWKIKWIDLDNGTPTGYANVTGKTLAIQTGDQAISGFMGTVKAPGDTITYTWKVKNDGDINATLAGVTLGTLSCEPATGSSATQAEATALCSKLSIAFTYGGTAVTSGTTGLTLPLNATEEKAVTMVLTYAAGDAATISGDVAITLSTTSFQYDQAAAS